MPILVAHNRTSPGNKKNSEFVALPQHVQGATDRFQYYSTGNSIES